uniref:diaminopimelate decarboxylase family protein n=1 Tax=Olsenella uli TaxID=133926 RepID=UPI0028E8D104|nr:alanine racemase [Olsenella uli]
MASGLATAELLDIAREFGTPTYLFDLVALSARLAAVREILGPSVRLCYSIKANPFLSRAAAECGYELEVCSPGELDVCRGLGIEAPAIVYSGVCKGEADVRAALDYGVGVLTAESPRQFELVEQEARRRGLRVPVLLRLNGGSQFGMSRGDLERIVRDREGYGAAELVGIHYFVGTQRRKLQHQRRELQMLCDLADELERRCGWRPVRLEYGPGLAVPYFEGEDFSDTLAPARELAGDLQAVAGRFDLTVEMGRFLASSCGSYLTSVVDLKDGQDDETCYAFVDGGINHVNYLGQMMGLKLPVIRNASVEGGSGGPLPRERRPWTLCGSLCTTNDVLVRQLDRPLAPDDVLVFENIGAYSVTESMYLFLSRAMPRVILRRGRGDYVLARDVVQTSMLNMPS